MSEDADTGRVVVEVRAKDPDTGKPFNQSFFNSLIHNYDILLSASVLQYSITEGNINEAFAIRSTSTSGLIIVKEKLDYETIRQVRSNNATFA